MFTWWNLQRYFFKKKGEGMVEYARIIGLVALGCVVTMTTLGIDISNMFINISNKITGIPVP